MLGGDARDVGGGGGDYGRNGRHDGAGHHGGRLGPLGGAPAPDDVHPLGRSSCWRRRRVVHTGRSILLWLIWNPRGLKAALGATWLCKACATRAPLLCKAFRPRSSRERPLRARERKGTPSR